MEIINHVQVDQIDYKAMALKTLDNFDVVVSVVFDHLQIIVEDRQSLIHSEPCKYPPLLGWRKIRFHVGIDNPPDMRIIFKYDNENVHVLAIGFRNYIYNVAEARDQSKFQRR